MRPVNYTEDLGDRVWWALHCLPREKSGKAPSSRSVELASDPPLANGTIAAILRGDRQDVTKETLGRLAAALRVEPEWLLLGKGKRPVLEGTIGPRPARALVMTVRDSASVRYATRQRAFAELRSDPEFGWATEAQVLEALDAAGAALKGDDPGFAFWFDRGRENLRKLQRGESLDVGEDFTEGATRAVARARKKRRP